MSSLPSTAFLYCTHLFGLLDNMEQVYTIIKEEGKPTGSMRQRVVSLSALGCTVVRNRRVLSGAETVVFTKKGKLAQIMVLQARNPK